MKVDWIQRSQVLKLRVANVVDGRESQGTGEALEKVGPRDGRSLYQFAASTSREVDDSVGAARRAFTDGRWARLPVQRRKDVLYRLAALIEQHREELALLECLDVGKPITDALDFDVPAASATIRFCAEAADKSYGPVYGVDQSSLSYQLRRPLGVVAGVVGWNFPLLLAATKIGPVLATGNSLVLKPSELTSLSAAKVAHLALEAGLPSGVLNVVHGAGQVGETLALHSDVDLITFTGSSLTGKRLLIASGQSNMKRLILECGGKAPNVVFDDSPDLGAVADAITARAFWNQGQVCTASSRLLVQEGIREELLTLLVKKATALVPSDPLCSNARFGAVVSQGHKAKLLEYIKSGEQDGTRVAYYNESPDPCKGGFYVGPIIFDQVSSTQRIAREEIFGPVLSVLSFKDEEEAVRLANQTTYGLSAIVWTRDVGRAHRMSFGINAGWVVVNGTANVTGGPAHGVMSVGGLKESGLGAEGGVEGLEAYIIKSAVQHFI